MTNNIAKIPAKPKAELATGNSVAAMVPNSIESAWRLSEVIAGSGMAPKTYGTDPNKIMVGMLAGMEIGLTPFAALQSIAVINGNPSLWGDGALALVMASNLVEDMGETDDGHTATCTIKRVGRATPIVRTFSMDDAKKAGLAGKAGPWTQYTARMRQMRARAFALRDGFPDILKGLRIAEEVRDTVDFGQATAQPAVGVHVPLTGAALLEQAEIEADEPKAEDVTVEAEDAQIEDVRDDARFDEPEGDTAEDGIRARLLADIDKLAADADAVTWWKASNPVITALDAADQAKVRDAFTARRKVLRESVPA